MPPRKWSESLGRKLVEAVAEHGSVNRAATSLGLVAGWRTVWTWQRKGHTVDGVPLEAAIEQARREYATTLQDSIEEVMQELKAAGEEDDPSSARVSALGRRLQGLQWQLSKLLPRLYGDKVEHTGSVDHGLTVHVVDYRGTVIDSPPAPRVDGPRACGPATPAAITAPAKPLPKQ